MLGAILATSVFVAGEQGRSLERPLREEITVSVVTLAELALGVLMARDADTRARDRARAYGSKPPAFPSDDRVASDYAQLAAREFAAGRKPRVHNTGSRPPLSVHGAEVWTQDTDFASFAAVRSSASEALRRHGDRAPM